MSNVSIHNCQFVGAIWEEKSLQAIQTVAQALLNLTDLFKSQGISVQSFLTINSEKDNPITTNIPKKSLTPQVLGAKTPVGAKHVTHK
jgi:hypothetical protein